MFRIIFDTFFTTTGSEAVVSTADIEYRAASVTRIFENSSFQRVGEGDNRALPYQD